MYEIGDRVRTVALLECRDYTTEGQAKRLANHEGYVEGIHNSHGVCFDVRYDKGGCGTFDSDELILLEKRVTSNVVVPPPMRPPFSIFASDWKKQRTLPQVVWEGKVPTSSDPVRVVLADHHLRSNTIELVVEVGTKDSLGGLAYVRVEDPGIIANVTRHALLHVLWNQK